ncbi:peptidylprolyl isomerase [Clostridium sp. SYSU_GA19001]|uniref:peptidylprolyl isomerase n=1 Tax=Clostridium caldaquaticum TaxID=2940653 RepID=UPI00207713E6|nr:peptidylprolyl isomerase [Clostridium caldaquaticum]
MKNIRKIAAAALISVFTVALAGCNMITKTDEAIKKSPVAKFGNMSITKGELDEELQFVSKEMEGQYKSIYGEEYVKGEDFKKQKQEYIDTYKKQILDSLITKKIALNKAAERNLIASDDEVNKKIEEYKKDTKEETIKELGYTEGFNDAKYKQSIKDQLTLEKLQNDIIKDVKVEDSEIQDYYNSNQSKFTEQPNKIHVAHILSATEEDAKKVKERLDKGEDFAKVAKEVSTEPAAKESGGDLGFIEYDNANYDRTFMQAAIALPEGKISNPVQTQFGWHIIKAIKKEEYPVKKLETVKEEIKSTLLSQKQNAKVSEEVSKWREEAKIKYYEKNM